MRTFRSFKGCEHRFCVVQETLASIAHHAAEVHVSIYEARAEGEQKVGRQRFLASWLGLGLEANRRYLEEERRFNSTTPKAFLELISFYASRHL